MYRFFFFLLFALPSLLFSQATIGINVLSNMSFPVQIEGVAATVVLGPNDPGAALFSITGEPGRVLKCSVTPNKINITAADVKKKIPVDSFLVQGCTYIDPTGVLNNVSIGARVQINSDNLEGDYSGTANFRVVYN